MVDEARYKQLDMVLRKAYDLARERAADAETALQEATEALGDAL